MGRVLLAPLLLVLCCAGPLLLLALAPVIPLLWGLVTDNVLLIAVAVILLVAIPAFVWRRRKGQDVVESTPIERSPRLTSTILRVPSIDCDGCIEPLRRTLLAVPGVRAVQGDARKRMLTVWFEQDQVGLHSVAQAIEGTGHKVAAS